MKLEPNLQPATLDSKLDFEYQGVRDGIGQALLDLGTTHQEIVVVSADLTHSLKLNLFEERFPERFFQVGVAEQNLAGVAAGLSLGGKKAFAGSYACFSPATNWAQIRTSICYNDLPVVILGGHAGLSVGPDGATHQALEDIALTRVLPNLSVFSPCDFEQARKVIEALLAYPHPAYVRFPRTQVAQITTDKTPFTIGSGQIFKEGHDLTLIVTGALVETALKSAWELDEQGISARVINIHTIKPLDHQLILEATRQTGAIITLEDHQKAGGLGSAVAEYLSESHPTPMKVMGVSDSFGESGDPKELYQKHQLDVNSVVKAAKKILAQKS